MSFLTPIWGYVDALVHPTAQQDALTAARHRVFIAPRLFGCFAALGSLPVYIALRGVPSPLEVVVFSWLALPILIVFYLSRSGRYERAHVLSSLALTGLATIVALWSGGIASFAAIWLVIVPVEAALSFSRRVILSAALFALGGAGLLLAFGALGLLPQPLPTPEQQIALSALALISATLYAAGLALGVEGLARTGFGLLHAEQDRYRMLADDMTDTVMRHSRNGSLLSVSPAVETLIGAPAGELLGNGLFDRIHVIDRPAYLAALSDAARLNEKRSLELRIRRGTQAHQAGQFVWAEMHCRPRAGADGEPEVTAVLRDISERKTQARAIENAQMESERAEAAKSLFVATMSHELRTPLNAIIGFSDMLMNELLELVAARKQEYAKLINDSGRHLLSLVNGILDVSKMQTGNFEITREPFAPAPAIESCADLLALKARDAGVDLRLRLAADLPEVTADRRAFSQVLINLLSNAIKFTPRDGRVTVGARRDGRYLVVTVDDTGVGIGEADMPRLGEAFFQARTSYDRRHDGSGLGLSIVKGLLHLHGGELDISSRLGEGTHVMVRLPIECDRDIAADPVKLMTERKRTIPLVNERVKKSA